MAAAAFLANGGTNVAAVEASKSGRRGPLPILPPGHAVMVVDDRHDKIDHFGVTREMRNGKMLEKNISLKGRQTTSRQWS